MKNLPVDGNDVISLVGLGLVGAGVGMWSVPAALVVVGGVLLILGVVGTLRRTRV